MCASGRLMVRPSDGLRYRYVRVWTRRCNVTVRTARRKKEGRRTKPTRASHVNHVSKSRLGEVVALAVSPEAAAPLATMKKDAAAEAAELRLTDTCWLPAVLTNRDTSVGYGFDDDEDDAADQEGKINRLRVL